MDDRSYITGIYKLNDHGIKQGIVPKFILQMLKLEEQAFMPLGYFRKSSKYITLASTEFTSFYDLHQEIIEKRREYYKKLLSKEIVNIQHIETLSIDRSLETELIQKVKDFFIKGRLLMNNWAKSEVIKDEYFDINNLLIVSDSNFAKQRDSYFFNDESARYQYLFKLIENGRNSFLSRFNGIRNKIEHDDFRIYYSRIELINGEIKIFEPLIDNDPIYDLVDFFYEHIFNFIENIMVYYYGINAYINWNGAKNLFKREEIDFDKQLYEYVILPNQDRDNMKKLIS